MEYKLYPNPIQNICTPFVYDKEKKRYLRYFLNPTPKLIVIQNQSCSIKISGCVRRQVIGEKMPPRELLIDYIKTMCGCANDFMVYLKKTTIIPTFSLSVEEAFVKTVIRQIITAAQARKIFSQFIKRYGYKNNGIYGFPNSMMIKKVTYDNLRQLGLGFRSKRILNGIEMLQYGKKPMELKGIGEWSKSILKMELEKDYSLYPFWDKSGEKIKNYCGIDLNNVAGDNKVVAGGIYLYAASYLETR